MVSFSSHELIYYARNKYFQDIRDMWTDEGVDINFQDQEGRTALVWASWHGHLETVKFLISKGANIDIRNKYGDALMWAVKNMNTETIKYLISVGAKINAQNKEGYTPLIWASMCGYLGMVKYLVSKGANINIQARGRTALNVGKIHLEMDVVNFLSSLKGPLSLQHIVLNLIEKNTCEANPSDELCSSHIPSHIPRENLPDILFLR